VAGSLGSSVLSIAAGATGDSIETQVNAVSANTGVTATARTTATIGGLSAAGTFAFTIGTRSGNTASGTNFSATISVQVTDTGNLKDVADAINSSSAASGVTATSNGSSIALVNEEGRDIFLQDVTATASATLDLTGGSGAAQTLGAAGTDSSTVAAKISFNSFKGFAVTGSSTGLFTTTNANSSTLSSVAAVSIGTQTGAQSAIAVIDGALDFINNDRGNLGAVQNRLAGTIRNLSNVSENVTAARSRIQDADFASETANLTRTSILQQAGISVLAQANALPQQTLALLQ
jgi:flagellin